MVDSLVKSFARDFSASSLNEIAGAAEQRAELIRSTSSGFQSFDAASDFEQLAYFARRIVELQEANDSAAKPVCCGDISPKNESGDRAW